MVVARRSWFNKRNDSVGARGALLALWSGLHITVFLDALNEFLAAARVRRSVVCAAHAVSTPGVGPVADAIAWTHSIAGVEIAVIRVHERWLTPHAIEVLGKEGNLPSRRVGVSNWVVHGLHPKS